MGGAHRADPRLVDLQGKASAHGPASCGPEAPIAPDLEIHRNPSTQVLQRPLEPKKPDLGPHLTEPPIGIEPMTCSLRVPQ